MKRFNCGCAARGHLFFDSTRCTACARPAGYCPDRGALLAFEPGDNGLWRALAGDRPRYRPCANREFGVCNWMIEAGDEQTLCRACRLNTVIPNLERPGNLAYWSRLEAAKRHALYTVFALGLPTVVEQQGQAQALRFRFMEDTGPETAAPVLTGHRHGLITINLAEADPVRRTRTRVQMQERYRTLLGHFRHELGHFYWDYLVASTPARLAEFREIFGDERADYAQRQRAHYRDGPPRDWPLRHISAYASMHPWEDWAETWAHFMHMTDTLDTAADFALQLDGLRLGAGDPIGDWMALAVGMNALNRSLGLDDPYPFVLTETIRLKLERIGHWLAQTAQRPRRGQQELSERLP